MQVSLLYCSTLILTYGMHCAQSQISDPESYTKTLGIKWNSSTDHFRLTVADLPQVNGLTKRALVSDIAKTFNVLGLYSPTTLKAKILLQLLWSEKVGWDDPVPDFLLEEWVQ